MTIVGNDALAAAASIRALDMYLDAAPRSDARPVETGSFTLFLGEPPATYYARPALSHPGPVAEIDLQNLEKACAENAVGLEIEWVHEVHPELAGVAAGYGLTVKTHQLMVAKANDVGGWRVDATRVAGATVRVLGADDPALRSGRAVAHVSFTFGGTSIGVGGVAERAAAMDALPEALISYLNDRARTGLTVTAVAESADGVLAVGSYQPIGNIAEIVAVATLPAARRQGLAGAVTVALTRHALGKAVHAVFLSAQDDDVARVYGRVGFCRAGYTHAAKRPVPTDRTDDIQRRHTVVRPVLGGV